MDRTPIYAVLAAAESDGFRKGLFVGGTCTALFILLLIVAALVISHRQNK